MATVALVGTGNIGSHLAAHLARTPEVDELILVDPDRVEDGNVQTQDFLPHDVRLPKAVALARRLGTLRPRLRVRALAARVEALPLGRLCGDVVASGLDSIASRIQLNERVWRLGVPWVDAAVGHPLLARVNVYLPGPAGHCFECTLGERQYAEVARSHACSGEPLAAPRTGLPSSIGALAGALAAIEVQKLLADPGRPADAAAQVFVDAAGHGLTHTRYRRNPGCRFDHDVWRIRPLDRNPGALSLEQALSLCDAEGGGEAALSVSGATFVDEVRCSDCGALRRRLSLWRRWSPPCERCGGRLVAAGFAMRERLLRRDLSPLQARGSLAALGVTGDDVFSVGARHFSFARQGGRRFPQRERGA